MEKEPLLHHLMPYILMLAIACLIVFYYYFSPTVYLDWLFLAAGVAGGVVSVYFMQSRLSQERTLQFYDGEQVLLTSHDRRSYALIRSIGDKDLEQKPISATIYLTNMGIIVEPPGTGEIALFIPLDSIHDFSASMNGITIKYSDVRMGYTEALIYVDNREQWLATLGKMYQ